MKHFRILADVFRIPIRVTRVVGNGSPRGSYGSSCLRRRECARRISSQPRPGRMCSNSTLRREMVSLNYPHDMTSGVHGDVELTHLRRDSVIGVCGCIDPCTASQSSTLCKGRQAFWHLHRVHRHVPLADLMGSANVNDGVSLRQFGLTHLFQVARSWRARSSLVDADRGLCHVV